MFEKYLLQSTMYKNMSFQNILRTSIQSVLGVKNFVWIRNNICYWYIERDSLSEPVAIITNYFVYHTNNINNIEISKKFDLDLPIYRVMQHSDYLYQSTIQDSYISLIESFFQSIILTLKQGCLAIYEHLSQRTYEDNPLSRLDVIENEFVKIVYLLDQINLMKSNEYRLHYQALIKNIISLFNVMIKLSGARSLLADGIIQLNYHFQLFAKLFLLDD